MLGTAPTCALALPCRHPCLQGVQTALQPVELGVPLLHAACRDPVSSRAERVRNARRPDQALRRWRRPRDASRCVGAGVVSRVALAAAVRCHKTWRMPLQRCHRPALLTSGAPVHPAWPSHLQAQPPPALLQPPPPPAALPAAALLPALPLAAAAARQARAAPPAWVAQLRRQPPLPAPPLRGDAAHGQRRRRPGTAGAGSAGCVFARRTLHPGRRRTLLGLPHWSSREVAPPGPAPPCIDRRRAFAFATIDACESHPDASPVLHAPCLLQAAMPPSRTWCTARPGSRPPSRMSVLGRAAAVAGPESPAPPAPPQGLQ